MTCRARRRSWRAARSGLQSTGNVRLLLPVMMHVGPRLAPYRSHRCPKRRRGLRRIADVRFSISSIPKTSSPTDVAHETEDFDVAEEAAMEVAADERAVAKLAASERKPVAVTLLFTTGVAVPLNGFVAELAPVRMVDAVWRRAFSVGSAVFSTHD
eukprot:427073-Pleurochrysis_carterae.AAC.3